MAHPRFRAGHKNEWGLDSAFPRWAVLGLGLGLGGVGGGKGTRARVRVSKI